MATSSWLIEEQAVNMDYFKRRGQPLGKARGVLQDGNRGAITILILQGARRGGHYRDPESERVVWRRKVPEGSCVFG